MKITFFVTAKEYSALVKAALVNLRSVPDQAHRFVLDGLEKDGYIREETDSKNEVKHGQS